MSKAKFDRVLFKYIEDFVSQAEKRLLPFWVVGDLNTEFIRGNQHVKIDPTSLSIVKKKYPPNMYKEKKIFNKMFPIYLARQGILTANRPIPGFKPDHNEPESVESSIRGNRFIKEFSKEENISSLYSKMVNYADIGGFVWIKTGIDFSKGDQVFTADVEIKDPRTDTTTKKNSVFYEGRPFVNVCHYKEVFPGTLKGDGMKDVPALVHRLPLTLKTIKSRWGVDVTAEQVAMPVIGPLIDHGTQIKKEEDYAYVYEFYENPSAERPEGRYVVAVRNQILVDQGLPYKNAAFGKRRIPFDLYQMQNLPKVIPGVTAYAQIVDIQDTYNSINNRLLEYINQMAIGQMYEYQDSLLNPNQWTNTPGERIILRKHARPPVPVKKERLGNELVSYKETIREDMLVAAGLSPLTAFGQSKSNMRSDGVVDAVAEADQNKLTIALQNASNTMIEVVKKILYLETYRQELLTSVLELKPRDDFVVKYPMDNVDPEELIIINREFLLQSDAVIEKKVAQATNFGLYNPEFPMKYRSKLEFLEAINSGYLQDTLDPIERVNFSRVQREHARLRRKEEIHVQERELHELHVDEHVMELLSPELEQLQVTDPDRFRYVAEALRAHIEEHQHYINEKSQSADYENAKAFE